MRKENNIQTQCPHCQTIFRASSAHLNIAKGHVRCSRCHSIFNALNYLLKESTLQKTTATHKMHSQIEEMDIPDLSQEDIYKPRSLGSFLVWTLIVISMTGLLLGQTIWITKRDLVLQHPEIRPWLIRLCDVLLCDLPQTRNVGLFHVENHLLQVHPTIPNALQADVTFTNLATFAQPYPELELTLENTEKNAVARRIFTADEYMQAARMDQEIQSNGSVHLRLELINADAFIEGKELIHGYRFDFL